MQLNPLDTTGKTSVLFVTALALVFLGLGLYAGQYLQREPAPAAAPESSLKLYPQPKIIADFALIDQHGEALSLADLKGRWTLVFLGFTHCPDVCPTTLSTLAVVAEQLGANLRESMQPRVLFISVDPERDHPAQLDQYVSFFDPGFAAATGDAAQLRALSHQLGAIFKLADHDEGDMDYGVDHSAGIFLLDSQARLRGMFPAPHQPNVMVKDLQKLLGREEH